jgi:hypothetical protein
VIREELRVATEELGVATEEHRVATEERGAATAMDMMVALLCDDLRPKPESGPLSSDEAPHERKESRKDVLLFTKQSLLQEKGEKRIALCFIPGEECGAGSTKWG